MKTFLPILLLTSSVLAMGTDPMPTPPPETCTTGSHRCYANDTIHQVCNDGVWAITENCATGYRCLGCGDWECVKNDQYDYFAKQFCNGTYSGAMEKTPAAAISSMGFFALIAAFFL